MSRRSIFVCLSSLAGSFLLGGSVAAGGGCHNNNPSTDAAATAVLIRDCGFAPTIVRVPVGATVTWTNTEQLSHVVTGVGWGQTQTLALGGTFSYTFTQAGIYPYSCFLHPGMDGAVVVGEASPNVPLAQANASPANVPLAQANAGPDGPAGVAWPLTAVLSVVAAATGFGFARRRRT